MKKYAGKTITEMVKIIMADYDVNASNTVPVEVAARIDEAIREAFEVGWRRGEDFARVTAQKD